MLSRHPVNIMQRDDPSSALLQAEATGMLGTLQDEQARLKAEYDRMEVCTVPASCPHWLASLWYIGLYSQRTCLAKVFQAAAPIDLTSRELEM